MSAVTNSSWSSTIDAIYCTKTVTEQSLDVINSQLADLLVSTVIFVLSAVMSSCGFAVLFISSSTKTTTTYRLIKVLFVNETLFSAALIGQNLWHLANYALQRPELMTSRSCYLIVFNNSWFATNSYAFSLLIALDRLSIVVWRRFVMRSRVAVCAPFVVSSALRLGGYFNVGADSYVLYCTWKSLPFDLRIPIIRVVLYGVTAVTLCTALIYGATLIMVRFFGVGGIGAAVAERRRRRATALNLTWALSFSATAYSCTTISTLLLAVLRVGHGGGGNNNPFAYHTMGALGSMEGVVYFVGLAVFYGRFRRKLKTMFCANSATIRSTRMMIIRARSRAPDPAPTPTPAHHQPQPFVD